MIEIYEKYPPGTLFRDEHGEHWLKPEQSVTCHLEDCLIGLFDGKIIHFSKAGKLTPVYGNEVMW